MASLPNILLLLAALSAGALVITILVALRSQKEAQNAIFPIVREEESIRAKRALLSIFIWLAVTALFLGGWLATIRLTSISDTASTTEPTEVEQPATQAIAETIATTPPSTEPAAVAVEPSPTETIAPIAPQTQEQTVLPTDTSLPQPTDTPIPATEPPPIDTPLPPSPTSTDTPVPPSPTPTETDTPQPTATSTPNLAEVLQVPTPAERVPAPAGAKMGPIQFAEGVTDSIQPVNPGDNFSDGTPAIYAIYPFSGIPEGVISIFVWYKNGKEIEREQVLWPWGERGRGFLFLAPRGPGLYKLELYVNDTVLATGLFEVR